jgi:hypothetical protein
MWTLLISIIFPLLQFDFELSDHAIYLSSTELEIRDDKILITAKVFSDDLRDAIKNHDAAQYQPGELQHFASKNSNLIQDYFRHYLTVKNEKGALILRYVESTVEGDAHFVQMQIAQIGKTTALSINASFFMELFPTQMNVVVVKQGDEKTYLKYTYPATPQQINLLN